MILFRAFVIWCLVVSVTFAWFAVAPSVHAHEAVAKEETKAESQKPQKPKKPKIFQKAFSVTPIKDNLYLLTHKRGGGNIVASFGPDGIFMVDDQLPNRGAKMDKALASVTQYGEQDVRLVFNTHYHYDHTGGNNFYGRKGTKFVAHENVRRLLSTKQHISFFNRTIQPQPKEGLPFITFDHGITLHWNEDTIALTHVPRAHTDGDAFAYFKEDNVIATGDLVFNGLYPFIDTEHGGSISGILAGINMILYQANDETIIVPGHGKIMTKAELQDYHDILSAISARVTTAYLQKKPLKEFIAENPIQDFEDKRHKHFLKDKDFLTILYTDLENDQND